MGPPRPTPPPDAPLGAVTLVGTFPDELLTALDGAGLRAQPAAALALLRWSDPAARARAAELGEAWTVAWTEAGAPPVDGAADETVTADDPDTPARLARLARLADRVARRRARELDESRRTAQELQSTRDLLGRLIDATPDPVMAADGRGGVLVFNRAAEAALDYEGAWARQHLHVSDVYADPADARRVLAEIRASPSGILRSYPVRLRARSGAAVPVHLSAAEVYAADGMPVATVGIFADQRQRLSLQDRLDTATTQLILAERRATALEAVGRAVHELNQPLTTAIGALELLEMQPELPDAARPRIARVYDQLDRMASLVRSLAAAAHPPPRPTPGALGPRRDPDLD
jgi:PAS domain-containing protein